MAKKQGIISALLNLCIWLAGILVSLAVGFGMIDGVLTVMWIPSIVTVVAGWIIVVLTVLGAILALISQ